ncbi:dUTP diphosphatase [Sulfurimonas sp. MAG313]|nr:dUTP diphosphatase [Sulfurimonas sp. MAG313]MDF1881715.1 dUTP diphosphatase [Sulfurimonas sp. MAG313]
MQKILEMLKLQQELNDATNGTGWENGFTKNGKIIDWKRCIYMESAELIDSFAWKHWKAIDKAPDWDNIKVETIDIWHFALSLLLQEFKLKNLGSLEDLAKNIVSQESYLSFSTKVAETKDDSLYEVIKMVEEMMFDVLNPKDFNLNLFVNNFFIMALNCGVDLNVLYSLYIGKNVLNRFRQDNGYKEGSYIKIWDGSEDNVVMLDIMAKNPSYGVDELYSSLAKVYKKL